MRTHERIPIHDHADRDSGGLVASSVVVRLIPGSEGGTTSGSVAAAQVPVADAAGNFTGENVEDVLAELAGMSSALVVADDEASVTVDPVTTLQFEADDFAVTDEGSGVAKVTFIGTAAAPVPPVVVVVDGGGEAIAAGVAVAIPLPTAGEFTAWRIVADQAGDIVFDLQVAAWADYPPDSGDSIVATAPPELDGVDAATDSTLTGWTVAYSAGDVLRVVVDSAATVEHVTLTLERA